MGQTADEVRREIEMTRSDLGYRIDEIEGRVRPSRIVERRTNRMKSQLRGLRERVMGSREDEYDSYGYPYGGYGSGGYGGYSGMSSSSVFGQQGQSGSGGMGERVGDMAHTAQDMATRVQGAVQDTMHEAPQMMRRRTEGNPMAAGLIAFGVGMLFGGLIPGTEMERQAVQRVEPALEPVKEQVAQIGSAVGQEAKESAGEAMHAVQEKASGAASTVKDEAASTGKETVQSMRENA